MSPDSAIKERARLKAPEPLDFATALADGDTILERIAESGFVVLRGVFAPQDFEAFLEARRWWFKNPAAGGTPGYCKFDYPKKVVQTSLLGAPALRMILDERLIDLIERYSGESVVVSESFTKLDRSVDYVYFPAHADYFQGYRSNPASGLDGLSAELMAEPLGLSHVVYHHDTSSGAFCYAAGSHKHGARLGGMLYDYPEEEQAQVLSSWTRVDGKAGDMVLFDPRGFHGQDQPSPSGSLCLDHALLAHGHLRAPSASAHARLCERLGRAERASAPDSRHRRGQPDAAGERPPRRFQDAQDRLPPGDLADRARL